MTCHMHRSPRCTARRTQTGAAGLLEVAAIVLAVGILTTAGLFTYRLATNSGADQATQSNLRSALGAANDVYNDTQDYTAVQASQLADYDRGATFVTAPQTSYQSNTIVYGTGPLSNGDPGGYIGLAALSRSGTCWQVYSPADGPPSYGSSSESPCAAPTAAPGGSSW